MQVQVEIINAFIDGETGGNPAGVVFDADRFTVIEKQKIAKLVGLSETAFVSCSESADFKLEFFTPSRQIAHCGHATIAAFSYLKNLGKIEGIESSKETIDGNRAIRFVDAAAYMEQKAPIFTDVTHRIQEIADAIGVSPEQISGKPYKVNTGNSFFIINIPDRDVLRGLKPDYSAIERISDEYDLIGFYPFTTVTNYKTSDASTRMFAPRYGILEEAATGMAAGPLACYLHNQLNCSKSLYVIEQGFEMPEKSPSLINVHLDVREDKNRHAVIKSLMAGGLGVKTDSLLVTI